MKTLITVCLLAMPITALASPVRPGSSCRARAEEQLSTGLALASGRLLAKAEACAKISPIDARQLCANDAFAAHEAAKAELQKTYEEQLAQCR